MNVKVKQLHPDAKLPEYQTAGAACFDLASIIRAKWVPVYNRAFHGERTLLCWEITIGTGLAFEIPEGYRMDIYPRSSMGFKFNAQLANGTGKIDSDYRGEILVKMVAFCDEEQLPDISPGTRIVQCEINKVTQATFTLTEELSDTERGEGGFGSTGA